MRDTPVPDGAAAGTTFVLLPGQPIWVFASGGAVPFQGHTLSAVTELSSATARRNAPAYPARAMVWLTTPAAVLDGDVLVGRSGTSRMVVDEVGVGVSRLLPVSPCRRTVAVTGVPSAMTVNR